MKIAICIPAYGDTKARFTMSLMNMVTYFLGARLEDPDGKPIPKEVATFVASTSMLTEGRHKLVAEALNWGADYMLCLDADHTFPPETLDVLLSHNKFVVGCNYARRGVPTAPAASKLDDKGSKVLCYTTPELAEAGVVEPVAHLGMGLVLINMKLFDVLQAKAEADGNGSFMPLFMFTPAEDGVGMRGEDAYFFDKCRAAGIDVFCDHSLSWDVGHVTEIVLTHRDAIAQKQAWSENWREGGDRYGRAADRLDDAA